MASTDPLTLSRYQYIGLLAGNVVALALVVVWAAALGLSVSGRFKAGVEVNRLNIAALVFACLAGLALIGGVGVLAAQVSQMPAKAPPALPSKPPSSGTPRPGSKAVAVAASLANQIRTMAQLRAA